MSLYRNRYFLAGMLFILLGIQFRMVHSFVLNDTATRVLAKVDAKRPGGQPKPMRDFFMQVAPNPTKRVTPPRWFGLSLIAAGAVITCHAVAIPKSSG